MENAAGIQRKSPTTSLGSVVQAEKTWEGRKPGPVRFRAAIIYLALQLPTTSSDQPERARSRAATYFASKPKPTGIMSFCLFLLQVGFT